MNKKLLCLIAVFSTIMFNIQYIFAAQLIPSGESIGLILQFQGVYISDTYNYTINNIEYNPKDNNFLAGDLITHINGIETKTINDLALQIQAKFESGENITATLIRNSENIVQDLPVHYDNDSDTLKTGLYVKDLTAGIGTMTFYNPSNHTFGSLGHSLNDTTLNLELFEGKIYYAPVTGIVPNSTSNVGEKIATIDNSKLIGDVLTNTEIGVFGTYTNDSTLKTMETATIDEINLGEAYIMTSLNNQDVQYVKIKITTLEKQTSQAIKGIGFIVTDNQFLKQTNGIIQGISGSPIIQNDKIIGAVSHVNGKNKIQGYGVYIEWMLKKSEELQ